MPQLFFISPDGERHEVSGRIGDSVMDAGVRNVVPGMFGLCGGALACVTCHVYADESTASRCTPMQDFEDEMLDGTVTPRQSSSRLSCQIVITEDLEGGTFTVPDKNY
jgi:2Fe-2S ferredoxin